MRRCPTEYPKKRAPLHACPRLGKLIVSADVGLASIDVRFTPESGHRLNALGCPLCARSGHRQSRARANRSGRQSSASPGSMLLIDIGEPARTAFLAGNTKRVFKLN